jgi:hypothetical protein
VARADGEGDGDEVDGDEVDGDEGDGDDADGGRGEGGGGASAGGCGAGHGGCGDDEDDRDDVALARRSTAALALFFERPFAVTSGAALDGGCTERRGAARAAPPLPAPLGPEPPGSGGSTGGTRPTTAATYASMPCMNRGRSRCPRAMA